MKSAAIILVIFTLEMNIRGATTLNFPGSESSESQGLGLALNSFSMPEESSCVARAILAFEADHHDLAVTMARRIAASGNVDAIYLLGLAHETGQGVPQFLVKTVEYYERGVARGHEESLYKLSSLLIDSDNEADVARARAREMLEKQAAKDPTVAGRMLGEAYQQGRFTGKPAPAAAINWWKKSAEAGDVLSMNLLAGFYDGQIGFSDQSDAVLVVEYYRAAAEQGDTSAMVILATKLLGGEEGLCDEKEGREWIRKAIATVEPTGYLVLARLQNADAGIRQYKELAWVLGKIAEERGEVNAGDFVEQVGATLSEQQLTSAKKALENLKSGEKPD